MAGDEFVHLGLVRRRLLRQAACVLVFVLEEHRELPVLTWTVTPDVLQAHADVCDLDLLVTAQSSTVITSPSRIVEAEDQYSDRVGGRR